MTPTVSTLPPIDYVARWRCLVEARQDQGRRLDPWHNRPDHWAGARAARFRRLASAARANDPLLAFVRPLITPSTTVLDVGAGTGRHVLPLARAAARVTAIEPSPAMRQHLEGAIHESGLANVEVIAAAWPSAPNVEPADVVICSHVAYFVSEIEPFLRRLVEVNAGRCLVVLRHVQRELAILELFEQIWGEPRCLEPTFSDLFGVACQLGIRANVANVPFAANVGYESFDDAVATIKADLLNPADQAADQKVRDYLTDRLIQRDGRWLFDTPPTDAGVLWWEAKR